jgi:hypothetical protein
MFEQAWKIVCEGPLRWWWSEQLCLFTAGAWTVFLFAQGWSCGQMYNGADSAVKENDMV